MAKKEDNGLLRHLLKASTVGLNLVAATFVGLAVGYFLDKLFGTRPYLTVIFLILGIIAGFRELLKMARQDDGENKGDGTDKKDI
ncbi:MAG: AtpZ/AtpI family protein [Thermodesulfovibrionales bacterium]|nr:AtpZ/AtpI family protein [Thermodesulfovibrionales bacterium]